MRVVNVRPGNQPEVSPIMEHISHLVVALGFLAFLFSIPGSHAMHQVRPLLPVQWAAPDPSLPGLARPPAPESGGPALRLDGLESRLKTRLDGLLRRMEDLDQRAQAMGDSASQALGILLRELDDRLQDMQERFEGLDPGDGDALGLYLAGLAATLDYLEQALDETQFRLELAGQTQI